MLTLIRTCTCALLKIKQGTKQFLRCTCIVQQYIFTNLLSRENVVLQYFYDGVMYDQGAFEKPTPVGGWWVDGWICPADNHFQPVVFERQGMIS